MKNRLLEEILRNIDDLKKKIDLQRPLEWKNIEKFHDYMNELYTYESNGIEWNTLTLWETSLIINTWITISWKSLVEHFEVTNHSEAIEYIEKIVKNKENFDEKLLLDIHYLILKSIDTDSAGVYRKSNVVISGTQFIPPKYIMLDNCMKDFFEFYNRHKAITHPVVLAAEMHERLVTIHPFVDGNGRTARLVMNLILLQNWYPITSISNKPEEKIKYYDTLQISQVCWNKEDFLVFVAENVEKALRKYVEMFD